MKKILPILFLLPLLFSCSKNPTINPTSMGIDTSKFYLWEGLEFTASDEYPFVDTAFIHVSPRKYFSTIDTSFKSTKAFSEMSASQLANVDLVYVYEYSGGMPGFLDPVSASTEHVTHDAYNTDYWYFPELANSKQTIFYQIGLNRGDMDSIMLHPELFDQYWNNGDAGFMTMAESSGTFPQGAIVGAKFGYVSLAKRLMIAFKNVTSGKRGLMYIRTDQAYGWPDYIISDHTRVDILKEK
jgi:hypothetical protein